MEQAVDTAFMSTSTKRDVPVRYMQGGENVLWVLHARQESDSAFHRGASVAMLSQFSDEEEVLFPPCTMLEVLEEGGAEGGAGGGELPRRFSGQLAAPNAPEVHASRFPAPSTFTPGAASAPPSSGLLRDLGLRVTERCEAPSKEGTHFTAIEALPSFV